jgi:molybdenum cofactor cytidylyltransferase
MILIIGASAACDVRDVAPAAIVKSGGELLRLGMPVDPGNLAALGKLGGADVVLLPGSARSPQLSGADWILARLAAGMKVTAAHIAKMGVGGLLADIPQRPSPRILPPRRLRVHPVLLAAGSSRRMGRTNKLLADYRGMPLVRRAALNLANAAARGLFDDKQKEKKITVVTGCAAARVKEALAGIGAVFIHNPDYKTGMASSIRRALDSPEAAAADGLLIALADMPEVGADDFANIVGGFHPAAGRDIVVPSHQGKRGNPALIGRAHFPALAALRGDVGARAFLMEKAAFVAEVTAGAGVLFDVDDKGDLP